MLAHYFELAVRSLRSNIALTALTILAVGVGIGASMTVFTLLRAVSTDPIPTKSRQLFIPQIDNWGPAGAGEPMEKVNGLQDLLTYRDAMALMNARGGVRQTAMYPVYFNVVPQAHGMLPFGVMGRAVYGGFFPMFEVPFRAGGPWSAADDTGGANVVVIGSRLADKLFPGENPVGRTISLSLHDYQIVGVLEQWDPQPRFYDITDGRYAESEDVFLPFRTAIDRQIASAGNSDCISASAPGWAGFVSSECIWIGFWVELPTARSAREYRQFLANYAQSQRQQGRFNWSPRTELLDVRQWLVAVKIVPAEVRASSMAGFGFLLICLVNAAALLLAKFTARAAEFGVRRALGASRADILYQCLIETSVVGALGALVGMGLTVAGLSVEKAILPEDLARLAHLDAGIAAIAVALAIGATLGSGLYPTWRASRVRAAWHLKAQ